MRKTLFVFLCFLIMLFFTGYAGAANTTAYAKGTISIIHDGATDWVWSTDLATYNPPPEGIVIYSIQVNTGAAADTVTFRNGSLTGTKFFASPAAAGVESAIKYYPYGKRVLPYIEGDDTVADSTVLILIEVEPW